MSIETEPSAAPRKEKSLTIGAVTKQLEREFSDITISEDRAQALNVGLGVEPVATRRATRLQ